jgi:hypothetical protein
MNCAGKHDWTVRFPEIPGTGGPAEFRPQTMTFTQNRSELDFARFQFDAVVGEQLKTHTGDDKPERQPVEILLDGTLMATMMVVPNTVQYGDRATYMTLKDLQKSLDSGIIDQNYRSDSIQGAYEFVFEAREVEIINEIKFTFPDTDDGTPQATDNPNMIVSEEQAKVVQDYANSTIEADFKNVSPLRALYQLNGDLGFHSWIDKEGVLWVGVPEVDPTTHVAAPNDDRVWRYTEASVRHPREQIRGVALRGKWVDQPGWNIETDITQISDWFIPGGQGTGDYRVIGVAERTDIDDGLLFEFKNADLKRDGVVDGAKLALIEEMKNQNTGHIQINPDKSGTYTTFTGLAPGDFIHVVPHDKYFNGPYSKTTGQIGDEPDNHNSDWCGSVTKNESYTISGVQHTVHMSGRWEVTVDVILWPAEKIVDNIEVRTVYFDPNADSADEQFITRGQAHADLFENT